MPEGFDNEGRVEMLLKCSQKKKREAGIKNRNEQIRLEQAFKRISIAEHIYEYKIGRQQQEMREYLKDIVAFRRVLKKIVDGNRLTHKIPENLGSYGLNAGRRALNPFVEMEKTLMDPKYQQQEKIRELYASRKRALPESQNLAAKLNRRQQQKAALTLPPIEMNQSMIMTSKSKLDLHERQESHLDQVPVYLSAS